MNVVYLDDYRKKKAEQIIFLDEVLEDAGDIVLVLSEMYIDLFLDEKKVPPKE